jgi:hypothetical protein
LHVCRVHSVADAVKMMREFAGMWPMRGRGEEIIREVESLRKVRAGHRIRTAVLLWKKPYMSCNRDTYISDLVECCGGRNVFCGREERYFELNEAEIAEAEPELVLLPTEPYRFRAGDRFEFLARMTGRGLKCRCRIVSGEMLAWYGYRTLKGLSRLPEIIAGE